MSLMIRNSTAEFLTFIADGTLYSVRRGFD